MSLLCLVAENRRQVALIRRKSGDQMVGQEWMSLVWCFYCGQVNMMRLVLEDLRRVALVLQRLDDPGFEASQRQGERLGLTVVYLRVVVLKRLLVLLSLALLLLALWPLRRGLLPVKSSLVADPALLQLDFCILVRDVCYRQMV